MGQYYRPMILDGSEIIIYNRETSEGLVFAKLMEHAWLKNEAVGKVFGYIYHHPCRIAWVGDYTETDNIPNTPFNGNQIWEMKNENLEVEPMMPGNKFLVNHDKYQYIDLKNYAKNAVDENGWCTHPLPILTACGNGRGGGDYYGPNHEEAGFWAGDLISVEDEAPSQYENYEIVFKE